MNKTELIMELYFTKLKENAKIPERQSNNAGMDVYVCFDGDYAIIEPRCTELLPTGIASAFDENYYIQIQERGSSGSKGIKYSAGVIDSGYRGEWFLAAYNANDKPVIILKASAELSEKAMEIINRGFVVYPYEKALFQAIVHKVHNELETKEISPQQLLAFSSERGSGKLGSSGK